jgi:hypothetical protein
VHRKTFSTILTMYVAVALLLPILPARKMASGHSRKSLLGAVLEPMSVSAKNRDDDDRDLPVRDQENIQKSFAMPAGHKSLEIDNIWGSIEVVADTADKVELAVVRTTQAESKDKLERAKK